MFTIGFNNIGLLLLCTGFGLYFIKKYSYSKNRKYILFSLTCAYIMFNNKNTFSLNGLPLNNTIYGDILNGSIAISFAIVGYQLYKHNQLMQSSKISN